MMATDNSKRKRGRKILLIIGVAALCIAVIVCIILPPSLGRTKPFIDEYGNILEGSISEKTFVEINGASLGIFIMAKDSGSPVLLFLGGGPGIPEYFLEQEYPSGLADEFVVCYLEYRGTSLSYQSGMDAETMTLDQHVDDVAAVTGYLRERFGQEKIYLMGHSFGTYIGINTVNRHPKLYHSYIAMSQMADSTKSETLAYDYMYEEYKAQGNDKMVRQFEEYPVHTSEEALVKYTFSDLRDNAMHDLGVGTTHAMRSVISEIFFPSLRCTVYTQAERINIWRGKAFAGATPVGVARWSFNAFDEISRLEIPVYFFAGAYDLTCAYSLQKEYYEKLDAPLKAFYTFDHSAHSPLFEEPEKAMEILSKDVLTGTAGL